MCVYARHLAWLAAQPEGSDKSRRESLLDGGEGSPLLIMPDVGAAEYIIDFWHDAGTIGHASNGIAPLSWQEIQAWLSLNEIVLSNFEIRMIRVLSQEYCGEYYAASDKDRPAPHEITEDMLDRVAVGNKIKNVLSRLKKIKDESKYIVEESNI